MTSNNSSTFIGSSTYTPPATGMDTSPPPEFAQRSAEAPRPPSTGAGTPSGIDPSQFFSYPASVHRLMSLCWLDILVKLGLLPKRPVSLLREQTPSQPSRRDDSDDELEYTENPFEEK
jgi:hypothetical protein